MAGRAINLKFPYPVHSMALNYNIESRASLAVAYSGIAWGLFWIPLRFMDRAGITDAWATVVFYGIPFILFVPWTLKNWQRIRRCGWSLRGRRRLSWSQQAPPSGL